MLKNINPFDRWMQEKCLAKNTGNTYVYATIKLLENLRTKKVKVILSKEEVRRLLNATLNVKHKNLSMQDYSTGLRIGEAKSL